ncbi:TPA: DNA-3-methyladenine glycosylase [archaeon]|uniref:Putative 3-methyladenine DNA glycosylase n=1 Tax=Candidatus Naiadarchaeum limnaeum TaxID=2756139 RepID=A0A832XGX2_9ARCH|nr:DNA-3-methyladenine glycosylase [Candidatus Naiadarchaeum limnaeum]
MKILKRNFYLQPTLKVARELLGKILWYKRNGKVLSGKIVETEGYLRNDPACHASRGMTERNKVMFGPAGHAYVYFTYGMYHCLNAVTQPEGIAEAVLIRAVEPLEGIEIMQRNRKTEELKNLTSGPGKLTQAFGIDKKLNGTDLTQGTFVILDSEEEIRKIYRAPRIGIRVATDKLWRFYVDSEFVSKK